MDVLARLDDVRKTFGTIAALDGVDLELRRGEVLALLGPNGAGKTTAVSLVVGLRTPTSGRVELLGRDPHDPAARRRVGVTPQATGFPETLRVAEVARFVARHFAAPRPVDGVLDDFGLADVSRRQTGGLSGGQKRRLALALAFVGDPEVVLLDEPTAGLDVEARRGIREQVRAFVDGGGTVFLTTHDMGDVEALATRVAVLDAGRVVTSGSVDDIRRAVDVREVAFSGARADGLDDLDGVGRVTVEGGRVRAFTSDADALVRHLVHAGVPFSDLEVRAASLEEAFIALTGGRR